MGWFGKVVGGAIGAVVGGPFGAAAGAGLGHLIDSSDDKPAVQEAEPFRIELGRLVFEPEVGPAGPGLLFAVEAEARTQVNGVRAFIRLKAEGVFVRAGLPQYADSDGDLLFMGMLREAADGSHQFIGFLPYAALPPRPKRDLSCEIIIVDGAGTRAGEGAWTLKLPKKSEREGGLFTAVPAAAVAMASATGGLQREEVRAIRDRLKAQFELDEIGLEVLRQRLNALREKPPSLEEAAAQFAGASPELAQGLVEFLLEVAAADAPVDEAERAFILQFAAALGVPEETLGQLGLVGEQGGDPLAEHYATLELQPGAPWSEVKAAYRRLAGDYHPDKVAQLPKGFQQFATDKMKVINAAYEALRQASGA